MKQSLYRLKPTIQNYAWGKLGSNSLVGRLCGAEDNEKTPYAELWLGAHPKSPALAELESSSVSLDQLLESHPEIAGSGDTDEAGFSYLFKILSIKEALSIQVHPDKKTAPKLHKTDPSNYPDENHKPEIAVAITPVTMLYGFRPAEEAAALIQQCPELTELLGEKQLELLTNNSPEALKKAFTKIIKTPSIEIKKHQDKFLDRINGMSNCLPEETWTRKLCLQYPSGDPGTFLPFLMNLFVLEEDKGIYTEANIPHAYLGGDLVECMANSDNVVRAALTPKYRDVDTLLKITEFKGEAPTLIETEAVQTGVVEYKTPCDEFKLFRAAPNSEPIKLSSMSGPAIIMSYAGKFTLSTSDTSESFQPGQAALVPAYVDEFSISDADADCWIASSC